MHFYQNSMKEDTENYRPVSLTSVPKKAIEKIIVGATERTKNKAIFRHSQCVPEEKALS